MKNDNDPKPTLPTCVECGDEFPPSYMAGDECEDCYDRGIDYEPEPREDFGWFGEAGLWD